VVRAFVMILLLPFAVLSIKTCQVCKVCCITLFALYSNGQDFFEGKIICFENFFLMKIP
jgi:hypothetical protein